MADDNRYGRDDDRERYGYRGYDNRGDNRNMAGGGQEDRGFFERAADEVRSWFGDERADQRRHMDVQDDPEQGYHYHSPASQPGTGFGNQTGSQFGGRNMGPNPRYGQGGGYAGFSPGMSRRDHPQSWGEAQDNVHDVHYRAWRDEQMRQLDRDYDEFRRQRQAAFNREFDEWRRSRQTGQTGTMANIGTSLGIREHMEVVGSDGQHVGIVDHVLGDRIKLTRQDPSAGGHHHTIPLSWVRIADDKVRLDRSSDEVRRQWQDVDMTNR